MKGKGRPSKYDPIFCEKIVEYFDIEPYEEVEVVHSNTKGERWSTFEDRPCDLPTINGFARSIGVSKDTVYEWIKVHPEFSDSYKIARTYQEHIWITNSIRGLYNSPFTIFTGKNMFGWRDKTETDITSKGKSITPILNGLTKDVPSNTGDKEVGEPQEKN